MLALSPVPLKTAGERSVFAELTRWDTGGSVRAAVMASIPLADGQSQRRICDAVLFVPEGLAVVRIVEVVRQSGVVTAAAEGAWTIAPETGPDQVLQLSGGGSTPLDGLMRAGMDTAMKLRRAGLEPGRIARLTVLAGNVTGLVPADGDLGEGDQVALLEPRSLLLGIARASRYAAVDNPRLWTTADVRAALETLGLEGRGPSVEELNGEGFPYSPYVLRRTDLLTPAAMAAGLTATPGAPLAATSAPAPVGAAVPLLPEQLVPAPVVKAMAASAAAAQAADPSPVGPSPAEAPPAAGILPPATAGPPVPTQRDTVAIDGPADQDAGIGGFFDGRAAEPGTAGQAERRVADRRQSDRPERAPAPRTSVLPVASQPPGTSVFATPATKPSPDQPRFAYWTDAAAAAPEAGQEPGETGSGNRTVLLIAAGLLVVVLLAGAGWLLLGSGDGEGGGATGDPSSTAGSTPGPQTGTVQTVAGVDYTVEAVRLDATCAGHAYGEVADFLTATDCTGLSRGLYSTQVGGRDVVVSVSRVQMADAAVARELRDLADRNGSGNVSDLLREGVRYTGSPAQLSGAEYASALSGQTVTIVEAASADDGAPVAAPDLDRIAGDALALEVTPFPAD